MFKIAKSNLKSLCSVIIYKQNRMVSTSQCRLKDEMIDREDDPSIIIPKYTEKVGEAIETTKARLLYQSRKRGMLENGLILSTFAKKYLNGMTTDQLKLYDRLINLPSNDWEIYYWATGMKETPKEYNNEIMDLLKHHVQNTDREVRLRQPDL